MVPPIALGLSPQLAAWLATFLSGLVVVWSFGRLVKRFDVARPDILCAIAALMTAALTGRVSADLITAGLLLLYFAEAWELSDPVGKGWGWKCGVLGGALYLSKSYMLYFFAVHFTLTAVVGWRVEKRAPRSLARAWLTGLIVCGLLSGPWIAALSAKYGALVISRAGQVNIDMVGPDSSGYRQHKLLIPPSSPHAFNAWQDPSPDALPRWRMLSPAGLKQLARLLRKNLKLLIEVYQEQTIFWLVIILLFILLNESPPINRRWIHPVLAMAILPAGYLLVIIVDRYLWTTRYLLLLMGAAILSQLRHKWRIDAQVCRVVLCLGLVPILWNCIVEFRHDWNGGREDWEAAQFLRPIILPQSSIASCGRYEESLALAYYVDGRYYGLLTETAQEREYARELNPNFDQSPASRLPAAPPDLGDRLDRLHIQWLMVWPECGALPPQAAQKATLAARRGPLQLYRLEQ